MSWTAPDLWQWRWWGRVAGVQRSFTAPSQRGKKLPNSEVSGDLDVEVAKKLGATIQNMWP